MFTNLEALWDFYGGFIMKVRSIFNSIAGPSPSSHMDLRDLWIQVGQVEGSYLLPQSEHSEHDCPLQAASRSAGTHSAWPLSSHCGPWAGISDPIVVQRLSSFL